MKKFISVALVLVLSLSLVACGGGKKEDAPVAGTDTAAASGTFEGTAAGHNGDVTVAVTVEDGKITKVEMKDHEETDGIYQLAEEGVIAGIIEKNGTEGVDTVAGATVTSNAIIEAVNTALEGVTLA